MTGPLLAFEDAGANERTAGGPARDRTADLLVAFEADFSGRIDRALHRAFAESVRAETPPRLRDALQQAVFGGGARLRPSLCLAVAAAYGDPHPDAADSAAASVEFMHCASLVHDDLPCFDDAQTRRGKPTIHAAFDVPLAVLVGDALIVLAFATLGRSGDAAAMAILADATGPTHGVIAGQAWEAEDAVPLDRYHRAKTASLFVASSCLGAHVSGADVRSWMAFGDSVGRAYQATDDVLDAVGDATTTGKTSGRDATLGRPSVVRSYGVAAAQRRVERLLMQAALDLPPCPSERPVERWLDAFATKIGAPLGR